MKENTKFLWMYVGILFSFALILIIFAGLSQNNDAEQTRGLKNDITVLSQKNTELSLAKTALESQVNTLTEQNAALVAENETLKAAANSQKSVDDALIAASKAKDIGNINKVKEILKPIDPLTLTEAQFYIYNSLVN